MKTMEFGHGRLTGQPYARCECGWTCVYWEDEIDLIHECEQCYCEQCCPNGHCGCDLCNEPCDCEVAQ